MKLDVRDNCLSFIRFIAAFQVMFGHIVSHLEIGGFSFVDRILAIFQGVPIFFGISGFLIWFSIQRSDNYKSYLKKRFYRIYPELWGGVLVEITVLLLLYRKTNIRDIVLFTLTQGTIFQFWTPDSLRGYGCGTPNGSLWTICVLIQFYLLAWILYKLMYKVSVIAWGVAIGIAILGSQICYLIIDRTGILILSKMYEQTVFRYLWIFIIGMLIARYLDGIMLWMMKTWWLWLSGAAFFKYTGYDISVHFGVGYTVCVIMAVIGFAYRFTKINLKRDISYAMYIYHMTVVNAFIVVGFTRKVVYMVVAIVITIFISFVSTVFIGERYKKKI